MTEAARAAQREYQRRYRREHPDKVKQWQASFWERRAAQEQQEREKGGSDVFAGAEQETD